MRLTIHCFKRAIKVSNGLNLDANVLYLKSGFSGFRDIAIPQNKTSTKATAPSLSLNEKCNSALAAEHYEGAGCKQEPEQLHSLSISTATHKMFMHNHDKFPQCFFGRCEHIF
jgi:hypothetical protein